MILDIQRRGQNVTSIKVKPVIKSQKKSRVIESSAESTREKNEKTLKHSMKEGIFSAAKTGTVNNYITPLAIHLGFSYTAIILLASLPHLIGAILQLFVEKLTLFFRSRHKLMIFTGYLEAYNWLLIMLVAVFSLNNPYLLLFLVTIHAIFINIQNPIWNAILGDVIPETKIAHYFGKRNIFVGFSGLLSTLFAGIVLSKVSNISTSLGFVVLFFLGFVFARISVSHQERIYDPLAKPLKYNNYSFFQFLKSSKKNNFGVFATFFSLYKLSVAVCAPFFAIYLLNELNLSYFIFTLIISGAVLSSMVTTGFWTKFTLNQGSKKALMISSFVIPFMPLFLLFVFDWRLILLIELFSGVAWAGFNIASSTFIFEAVNPKQKIKFIAYNNVLAGIGVFIGTLIGIFINYFDLMLFGSVFFMVFFVSGILRLFVALFFVNRIEEEKVVSIGLKEHYKRFITIRPKEGVIFEIFGKSKRIVPKRIESQKKVVVNKKITNIPGKGPFKVRPKY